VELQKQTLNSDHGPLEPFAVHLKLSRGVSVAPKTRTHSRCKLCVSFAPGFAGNGPQLWQL
jgi:hypothetical protein